MDLISKVKPEVLCIQETVLSKPSNFILMYYNGIFKEGHASYRAHGEVAIFIHETIPYQNVTLNTP